MAGFVRLKDDDVLKFLSPKLEDFDKSFFKLGISWRWLITFELLLIFHQNEEVNIQIALKTTDMGKFCFRIQEISLKA